jgi:putative nucleotidyltransferase with HDIG domain
MSQYRNVNSLSEINFAEKDKVQIDATIIDVYSEGSLSSGGKRTPIKILLKLESSGELLLATSWVPEMLTTIREAKSNIKVYSISGFCSVYADAKQISIDELRFTGRESTQKYLSKVNADDSISGLKTLVDTHVKTPVFKDLVEAFIVNNENFKTWPAATRMHHAFTGGLLAHTLGVTKNAIGFAERYENIDTELVVVGSLLHDLGKLVEYTSSGERTFDGDLYGHLYIGAKMVEDFVRDHYPELTEEENLRVKLLVHIL